MTSADSLILSLIEHNASLNVSTGTVSGIKRVHPRWDACRPVASKKSNRLIIWQMIFGGKIIMNEE